MPPRTKCICNDWCIQSYDYYFIFIFMNAILSFWLIKMSLFRDFQIECNKCERNLFLSIAKLSFTFSGKIQFDERPPFDRKSISEKMGDEVPFMPFSNKIFPWEFKIRLQQKRSARFQLRKEMHFSLRHFFDGI